MVKKKELILNKLTFHQKFNILSPIASPIKKFNEPRLQKNISYCKIIILFIKVFYTVCLFSGMVYGNEKQFYLFKRADKVVHHEHLAIEKYSLEVVETQDRIWAAGKLFI
jgi:hypothetical protein